MDDELKNNLWFDPKLCFIGGHWVEPKSKKFISLINPSTGKELCEIARCMNEDVNLAVKSAKESLFGVWGNKTAFERGRILHKIGIMINERSENFALIESLDVGKPLNQSKADVNALCRYLEFYGGAADKVHGETIPYLEGYTVYSLREPHGVTGHIIPWNYPMQIIGRSVVGALAMGNAVVLKPSEEACLTALAFASICSQAGLPKGALNVIPGLGEEAGKCLSEHGELNHISFTGSYQTGQEIQRNAAKNVVPITLELGGKSPQIVFEDADIDKAMPFLINAGIQNAGQTCSASSRILIQKSIYKKVEKLMVENYDRLSVGPAIENHDVGPLISKRQLNTVQNYIEKGQDLNKIAESPLNKTLPPGFYFQPTLFGDVEPSHVLAQEEIFGPVQILIAFQDEREAIEIANGTKYGLVASIWSNDASRQMRLPKLIKAGQIFVNNYGAGGGVELPFGGVGHSGFGREKGFEALKSFSSYKTIAVKHG